MKKIIFMILIILPLAGCRLFSNEEEGQAFAMGLSGLKTEFIGLADAFQAISERSLTAEQQAEVLPKIAEARSKFLEIEKDMKELLEKNMEVDYEALQTRVVELAQELARLKTILGGE